MSFSIPITFLWWLLGVIAGISLAIIFCYFKNKKEKISGVIEVDIQSNLCKFHLTTTDLSNLKTKKAMFEVVHRS